MVDGFSPSVIIIDEEFVQDPKTGIWTQVGGKNYYADPGAFPHDATLDNIYRCTCLCPESYHTVPREDAPFPHCSKIECMDEECTHR